MNLDPQKIAKQYNCSRKKCANSEYRNEEFFKETDREKWTPQKGVQQ